MVKNKVTVIVMAIISFMVMPYACNKGLSDLYKMWHIVEAIKSSVISVMPSNLSTYIGDFSIKTVQIGFNLFLVGIRGLGFATMVYCISKRSYRYGFIIAILADSMNILNRIIYSRGFSFERNQLIVLSIPFAMWFTCMIISAILKGKHKILVVAVIAFLTYWGVSSFVYEHIYYNFNLAILGSMTILSSFAMEQMDM